MRRARWSLTLVILAACHAVPAQWRDLSPHTVRMVSIEPGVPLEVLDWGGHGPPLVLLPGLGNTGHVFDNFAPGLTDRYHVYGVTPRGFGASGGLPDSSLSTLISDLRIVLDSLGLSRVVLVGHSIAGEVLTGFAGSHPERCAALVYLDAASDPTDSFSTMLDTLSGRATRRPPMTSRDSESLSAVEAYFARTAARFPDAEVRAFARFDSNGRYRGEVGLDSAGEQRIRLLVKSLTRPAYARLQCPSLAIYAVPDSVAAYFPWYPVLDSAGEVQASRYYRVLVAALGSDRTQYRREAPYAHVVEIHNASHWVFLSNREETLKAIRHFLVDDVAPARVRPN